MRIRTKNSKNTATIEMTTVQNPTVKLLATESFENFPCNFYQNIQNEIFLTRKQIGEALGYKDPDDAIYRIHERHKDRLDKFSLIDSLSSQDGRIVNTILYTEEGAMEICRWSKKPKANDFMDWLYKIGVKYRHGELTDRNQLLQRISFLEQELATLRQEQTQMKKSLPKKKFSYWSSKMFPKYQLLLDHFNLSSYKDLYRELYLEFTNMYPNIDLNQLVDDYCTIHRVDSCFTMDAIEANTKVRDLFTEMVDYILETYHLVEIPTRKKTIFHKK